MTEASVTQSVKSFVKTASTDIVTAVHTVDAFIHKAEGIEAGAQKLVDVIFPQYKGIVDTAINVTSEVAQAIDDAEKAGTAQAGGTINVTLDATVVDDVKALVAFLKNLHKK